MASDEYTEQDRRNEGCCWDYVRQLCAGGGCLCNCHATNEEILLSDRATLRRQYDEMVSDNARLTGRIKTLEDDLEHALASVGAFRQAIEDVWSKSAGESDDDGFVVSYVIPVGTLHRAIGLARGTDAGGKLLAELAAAQAREQALVEAGAVLVEYVEHQPFSLARLAASEALRAALAAAGGEGQRAGDNDRG